MGGDGYKDLLGKICFDVEMMERKPQFTSISASDYFHRVIYWAMEFLVPGSDAKGS